MIAHIRFDEAKKCIFELDGLLLNTEMPYAKAMSETCEQFGKEYSEEVFSKHDGQIFEKSLPIIWEALDMDDVSYDDFCLEFYSRANFYLESSQLLPGAVRVVRHLYNNKIPIALVSISDKRMMNIKMARHKEFLTFFRHHLLVDFRKEKELDDMFFNCGRLFGGIYRPATMLVFVSSDLSLKIAHDTGMQVVCVPYGVQTLKNDELATQTIYSLDFFNPAWFGLPPFPSQ